MGQQLKPMKGAPRVKVGDNVVINMDVGLVRKVQAEQGIWVDDMKNYIGEPGKVLTIDPNGNVQIKFKTSNHKYDPDIVAKVLSKGDKVLISSHLERVKFLQVNHGGWEERMTGALGHIGTVVHVLRKWDVLVVVEKESYCFNPLLCTHQGRSSDDSSSDSDGDLTEKSFKKILDAAIQNERLRSAAEARKPGPKVTFNKGSANEFEIIGQYGSEINIDPGENGAGPSLQIGNTRVQIGNNSPKPTPQLRTSNSQGQECPKGNTVSSPRAIQANPSDSNLGSVFKVGDRAYISIESFNAQVDPSTEIYRCLINKTGTVAQTDRTDKIHLQIGEKGYLIPPGMLTKVTSSLPKKV